MVELAKSKHFNKKVKFNNNNVENLRFIRIKRKDYPVLA